MEKPIKVTAAKGNSFNNVVTTATRPELCAPRLLIQVTIQIRLMAKAPASRLSCPGRDEHLHIAGSGHRQRGIAGP